LLTTGPHFGEALAAIDGTAFAGLKGDFSVFTALGADRRVHLAGLAAAGAVTLSFPGLPTGRAPFGFVGVAFGLEELLLGGAEGKRRPAIGTLECLILKSQRMTSFLKVVG
jgi:hypothetical protein